MRKNIILMIFVLIFFANCKDSNNELKTNIVKKNSNGIVLVQNSSLRLDPFIFSTRLDQIDRGELVKIIKKSGKKGYIAGSKDWWYQIKLKNGISGWMYGKNLKIFSAKNNKEIEKQIKGFWKDEETKISSKLIGRWWSINRFGDYTSHGLDLLEDNKYKSYRKGKEDKAKEGDFSIDLADDKITFKGETTFAKEMKILKRGRSYYLVYKSGSKEKKFKRILEDFKKDKKIKKDENKNK